jgi:hypothetical protein
LAFCHGKKYFCRDGGKKLVKTGRNRQKVENAVYVTGIRSLTLPGSSKGQINFVKPQPAAIK